MAEALENHESTVSPGGRTETNMCFANDTDGLELISQIEHLNKASLDLGMEITDGKISDEKQQWHEHKKSKSVVRSLE